MKYIITFPILVILVLLNSITLAVDNVHLKFISDTTTVHQPSSDNHSSNELLLKRLDEINDMDKTNLTFADKRLLRQEVKGIKRELNLNEGGVYVSVGALLIIILLLIILL